MKITIDLVKLWVMVILVGAGVVVGWISGAAFGSNPPPPPEYDPIELYCLAITDTASFLGEVRTRTQYFQNFDSCTELVGQRGTFFDFPMEYGAEYLRSIGRQMSGGGPAPALR